jgi:DNA-binding LacI/PurR family transcriptional regulator
MSEVPVDRLSQRFISPESFEAYRECLRYIRRRGLKKGDRLPPQSELRKKLKICQGTLSKALDWLVDDEVLTRKRRVGTFLLETYPQKPVPPIWNVGVAVPMFQWNQTWPRLTYEVHRALVRHQCQDRIYMLSPRAAPDSEIDHRSLGDYTGLAGDVAAGSIDAVITHTRLDSGEVPVCHLIGPEDAEFGVLSDTAATGGEAATGLIRDGCRRLSLVLNGTSPKDAVPCWENFRRALSDAGLPCPPERLLAFGEGRKAGFHLADHLLSLPASERPDGLVVLDDHVASGLTVALRARVDYRPALAVLVNRQTSEEFLLPVTRYENDLELLARLAVEKLVDWLLDPDRPQTALKVRPRLVSGAESRHYFSSL